MREKSLAIKLIQAKELLEASDHQMAKHLKMDYTRYKELESGSRLIPLPAQKSIDRRLKGLFDRCGLG